MHCPLFIYVCLSVLSKTFLFCYLSFDLCSCLIRPTLIRPTVIRPTLTRPALISPNVTYTDIRPILIRPNVT